MQKIVKSTLLFGVFALFSGFALTQTLAGAVAVPVVKKNISSEQLARVAEKAELIRQIFSATQPDMRTKRVSPESQRWLLESLYQMPLEQIRAMGISSTFSATVNAMSYSKGMFKPKALGDTDQDLIYKPFVPCRYIDTRNVGGKISSPRGFDISLSGTSYGGIAACDPLT